MLKNNLVGKKRQHYGYAVKLYTIGCVIYYLKAKGLSRDREWSLL